VKPRAAAPTVNAKSLRTLNQIAEECPAIPLATLRWFRFADIDGFNAACVVPVGRRVLVDADRFAEWIARRAGMAA
jgi:hypothetical protein